MKTKAEIVDDIKKNGKDDVFGFRLEVFLPFLDFSTLREAGVLKPDATSEGLEDRKPLTREAVLEEMRDYMEFAWDKAANHRGLSASRSIDKMEAWLWLLDDADLCKPYGYASYGAPKLKVICNKYGFPIPDDPGVQRMMRGLPCRDDCEEGCGQ